MDFLLILLKRLLRTRLEGASAGGSPGDSPVMRFDEAQLAIARPGDIVVISLRGHLTPAQREQTRMAWQSLLDRHPDLRLVLFEGATSMTVVRPSAAEKSTDEEPLGTHIAEYVRSALEAEMRQGGSIWRSRR